MKINTKVFEPGNKVFLATVTKYYMGIILEIHDDHVLLSDASWVFDAGKMSEFVASPVKTIQEVEVYPSKVVVQINSSMIVEMFATDQIPTKTK